MSSEQAASEAPDESPAQQVAAFIAKFDPAIAKLARAARSALRKRFPTAVELVYDNYAALAIGWSPNERTSEVFLSLAVYPKGVSLYFVQGKHLPDPSKILQGSGNQGRFVRLDHIAQLDAPAVAALIDEAIRFGKNPLPEGVRGYTVIKSVSARQRPRRPT